MWMANRSVVLLFGLKITEYSPKMGYYIRGLCILMVHSEWFSSRTSFQLEDNVLDTSKPLFGSVQSPNIIVFILGSLCK